MYISSRCELCREHTGCIQYSHNKVMCSKCWYIYDMDKQFTIIVVKLMCAKHRYTD